MFEKSPAKKGRVRTLQLIKQVHFALRPKKLRVAIYDHAFHFAGGGQKYAAQIAAFLQKECKVTLICHKPVSFANIKDWYGLDLSDCQLKIIPLPEFAAGYHVYPEIINGRNPFTPVTMESANYDVFFNANMHPYITPLSACAIFISHFPDQERNLFFSVDSYNYFIVNSSYGREWLAQKWHIDNSFLLYPGVDLKAKTQPKDKLILSVARFEAGGSKKQLEMINSFKKLKSTHPLLTEGWRLILIGGSSPQNSYLEQCRTLSGTNPNIEIIVNAGQDKIKKFYQKAAIFWHFCGLNENRPHLWEHFGMTVVEALQNGCIPVVFNGGGPQEIVTNNGFKINSLAEAVAKTAQLIKNPRLMVKMKSLTQNASRFSLANFHRRFSALWRQIKQEQNLE